MQRLLIRGLMIAQSEEQDLRMDGTIFIIIG